jgi:UDP-glucose-4-epimerase GalE
MSKNILIAGGAGFIGSHTVAALEKARYQPIVLDNFSNGHRDAVLHAPVVEGDIKDSDCLDTLFSKHQIDAVVHFAAFIEAGESVRHPLNFYENNMAGTLKLLSAMQKAGIDKIVFSSTAAVYGQTNGSEMLTEDLPKAPINPYGESKWAVECMLRDCAAAHGLKAVALRYFNAAGSDPEGRFGERHDPETHLIPLVLDAAAGKRANIKIFGTDYDTEDGTCIRDYIHVSDLASAHVKALEHLYSLEPQSGYYDAFNLGTGNGFSVRQVIETCKQVTGVDFPVVEEARRQGDPAQLVANADKAKKALNWAPQYPDLKSMIAHAWAFTRTSR